MKLTVKQLEKKILEQVKQYEKELNSETNKTKEVEADEYADTVDKKVDWMKAGNVKEMAKRVDDQLVAEERSAERAMKKAALRVAEARNKRVHLRKLLEASTTKKINKDSKPKK